MHVFFDDEVFHWEKRGGVSRYVCEVAASLAADQGFTTTVFGGWCKNLTLREYVGRPGLETRYRRRDTQLRINTWAKRLSSLWRRQVFRRVRQRHDVVLYHPSLYAYDRLLCRRADAMAITMYDMQLEVFKEDTTHSRQHLPEKHQASRQADWIFCISEHTEKDLHHFLPETRGKTQAVLIDSSLRPLGAGETPPPSPCDGRPYFMIVGARRGYKNATATLRALASLAERHPEVAILLCGARPPGSDGELDFPGGEALRPRVYWKTPDDRDLAGYFSGSLGLIYPSSYEGFGLPVLEAMRCGCPVVTTRYSSLPEVGGDAVLYVEEPTPAAIAEKLDLLIRDQALRRSLAEQGRTRASRFSWKKTAAAMVEGYHRALEYRKAAAR